MIKLEIEGTDGAGKTTALKYILDQLQKAEQRVLETREVGSKLIPTCLKLREVVLDPESNLSGEAMELIFSAMRIENERYYQSVADDYDFIVSDRGWFSHLAYTDHNVSERFTTDLYKEFMEDYTRLPDVVIYLSVDGETALKRRNARNEKADIIELKGVEFQEKVRQSFEKHIKHYTDVKTLVIDANQDIEGVQKQLDQAIDFVLSLKK